MSHFARLFEFYETGNLPWDRADPPPEVMAVVPTLPIGRALDLGCGLGRASIFMARLGWQVDAVDFIPQAIESARQRAIEAGVAHKICFYLSDVTQLGFLHAPYDFALDVGCVHGIGQTALQPYHAGLLRLLPAGALYLLFAHLNDAQTQRWLNEPDLLATFSHGFRLDRVEYGTTQVNDQPPWRSAWYWFRRVS